MAKVIMKALRLTREKAGETPRLLFATVPKPKLIPNHLLVKVYASAIHPSDVGNAQGVFSYTQYPRIIGRDYAGVVEEGPQHLIGAEVYGTSGNTYSYTEDGCQAEYYLVHQDAVTQKPKNLSFAQAATLGVPFTTAALIIERADVKPSDTVLVFGAKGAVGSAVVQLARSRGARVLEGCIDDEGDINTITDPGLTALDTLTAGRGVDVVVDTVGSPTLTKMAIEKLSIGGRFVFITAPRTGSSEIGIEMRPFYRADLSLLGCNSLNSSAQDMARRLDAIRVSFELGRIKPQGVWTEVALNHAVETYEKLIKKATMDKYVIVMDV